MGGYRMNIRVMIKRLSPYLLIAVCLILIVGCQSKEDKEDELEELDAPQEEMNETETDETDIEEDAEREEEAGDETAGTVARELYLLSKEGLVVPQIVELPRVEEVAMQALEYLIDDGPVTNLLPNGFEAVLPAGTEVLGVNLDENGTLVVDLSEEFTEYDGAKERQIIEAMTYTLTQFESVDRIRLWINGYEQTEMPVNGMPIGNGYSRVNGINIMDVEGVDLMESEAVTLYYPTQLGSQFYHVPVTQHIEQGENLNHGIVEALLKGPSYESGLLHVFNPNIELLDVGELNEGVLSLEFTEEILADVNEAYIADEVIETIVLTLTDRPDISGVNFSVENVEQIFNEHGVPYSESVTRDVFVPTGSF